MVLGCCICLGLVSIVASDAVVQGFVFTIELGVDEWVEKVMGQS